MKRYSILSALTVILALLSVSCARVATSSELDTSEFDSWVYINKQEHPEYLWKETELGSYILTDTDKSETPLGDADSYPYVLANFTVRDLSNAIYTHNDSELAKQLGTYDVSYNYEPRVWLRGEGNISAGLEEVLDMLTIGEKMKVAVPAWLNTSDRFSDKALYKKFLDGTSFVYDLQVLECIEDITEYQIDNIIAYMKRTYPDKFSAKDSLVRGVYYLQLEPPTDTTSLESGNTAMINYIGRTLNGQAFDTTIKDTAKVQNIYSSSNTYEEAQINWADDATSITMGEDENSLIEGFKLGIFEMKEGEKGVVIFYSDYGYGTEEVSNYIPPYSPLIFEITMVSVER